MTPLLGYCQVVYDKAYNEKFAQKSIKYNASLRLWAAFSKTSRQKFYQKLSLESLQPQRRKKKLFLFHKIVYKEEPVYVFNLISTKTKSNYNTKNTEKATLFHSKSNYFKNIFFHPLLLNGT